MASRNWAQKTRVNYVNDVADLLRLLERQGKTDPHRVDLQDLEAYLAELDRRGYTGVTRRRKTSPGTLTTSLPTPLLPWAATTLGIGDSAAAQSHERCARVVAQHRITTEQAVVPQARVRR